jgi:hypothetical protein
MRLLTRLYRRLDRLQRGTRFHVAASILVVLVCGALFGVLLARSHDLDVQRRALVNALANQSLAERDEHAVSLSQSGTVVVNGRIYGGPEFLANAKLLFDEQGNLINPVAVAERMLADQRPAWAPSWLLEQPRTTWMLCVLTLAWLLLVIWLDLSAPLAATLLGAGIPLGIGWLLAAQGEALRGVPVLSLVLPWFLADGHVMLFIAALGLLVFTFVLLTRVALVLTGSARQIPAVAHAVIKEASRTNLSLVFIVLLLVILPLLPMGLDRASPLRFQIQTFMSRSMGLTFVFAACLTLFLSCATVAFEIRDRQIWQVMTKPVSRFRYLVGKWLGVVLVNLILLLVSSVSIFLFVQYLRQQPVAPGMRGQLDALAVRDEILTARTAVRPEYATLTREQVAARVEQEIQRNPDLALLPDVPLEVRRRITREVQEGYLLGQRTVPPRMSRTYVFRGLQAARNSGSTLALKYTFHILRSDEHETFDAIFWFNNDQRLAVRRTYVPTLAHVLSIPPVLVAEDGTLTVSVFNVYQPPPDMRGMGALNFELDGFELLYKVGDFEPNFLRAVLLNWIKLSFLAMLGIAASTTLSFSVSCLLAFTVFVGGSMAPYLAHALENWYPPPTASMDWSNVGLVITWAFEWFVKGIAEAIVFTLRAFGEYSAAGLLVEGRYIPWSGLFGGFVKLGVIWSGGALLTGYLMMRSRQLAIYSGHG